jgi:hypothetical protein
VIKASKIDLGCPDWMTRMQNWSWVPPEFPMLQHKRDCRPSLFFGMEIEISTKLSCLELQYIATQVEPKQEGFFYFKSDSSITGRYNDYNPVEIVTVPMTPRYAKQAWRIFFNKIENLCAAKGMQVPEVIDTNTDLNNGLHIHLSKNAFQTGVHNLGGHKNRFIAAWNLWDSQSQEFYRAIGKRRLSPKNSDYYHLHPDMDGRTLARRLLRGVAISSRDSRARHSTCHESRMTVELRIFQGIWDISHVLACIEITLATFEFTSQVPLTKLNRMFSEKFRTWIDNQSGYKYAKEAIQCV